LHLSNKPPLPAEFAAELAAVAGAPASSVLGLNIWSGVSLPQYGAVTHPKAKHQIYLLEEIRPPLF
jgi:hypothetical protein